MIDFNLAFYWRNGRTQSAFWSTNETANIFKTLDENLEIKGENPKIVKGSEITEDVEFLNFDRQASKESECEFLIIDDSSSVSKNFEASRAILNCIRKIKNNCKEFKPLRSKGISNYLEELDQLF